MEAFGCQFDSFPQFWLHALVVLFALVLFSGRGPRFYPSRGVGPVVTGWHICAAEVQGDSDSAHRLTILAAAEFLQVSCSILGVECGGRQLGGYPGPKGGGLLRLTNKR